VLLIGNAVHASPPQMGQKSIAIEDAVVLREANTVENALDAYITRRRPRTD